MSIQALSDSLPGGLSKTSPDENRSGVEEPNFQVFNQTDTTIVRSSTPYQPKRNWRTRLSRSYQTFEP